MKTIATVMAAAVLVASGGAATTAHADDLPVVEVPGGVYYPPITAGSSGPEAGGTFQFTLATPAIVEFIAHDMAAFVDVGTPSPLDRNTQLICYRFHGSTVGSISRLPAGTYTHGVWSAPTTGPNPHVTSRISALSEWTPRDLQISEEEGGLDVRWHAPSGYQRCLTGNYTQVSPTVTWSRNDTIVGTRFLRPTDDRVFLDGLTVGIKYKVTVTYPNEAVGAAPLVGTGVPRIPSVLLMQAPRRVAPLEAFPVRVSVTDRRGRPAVGERVTLYYQQSQRAAATATAAKKKVKVKTVRTDRKGRVKTRVKVRRSGTLTAQFNASGRLAASDRSVAIRVRRR